MQLYRGGCLALWVRSQAVLTGSGSHRSSYGGFAGGHPHFHPHSDCRKRYSALRQTARKQCFTRLCPARLDISWCSARVYRNAITDVLLQTPPAQELLPGGELSKQSWWP